MEASIDHSNKLQIDKDNHNYFKIKVVLTSMSLYNIFEVVHLKDVIRRNLYAHMASLIATYILPL